MPALLDPRLERFAQLLASGVVPLAAYDEVYPHPATREKTRRGYAKRFADKLLVQQRVEEIRRPVIQEIRQTMKYELSDAVSEIDRIMAFARALMQPAVEMRGVELKAKLAKMLGASEKSGTVLDTLSTEDLLELVSILDERKRLRTRGDSPTRVVKMADKVG